MNPFTERGRITSPARFTGRWRELSMIFERLEQRRPTMIVGAPGTGKSSLLTHIAQSAGAVLEMPELLALFLDLALLPDAATAYGLITRELGRRGASADDLEAALGRARRPVIICMDGADAAIDAGWGAELLERTARLARRSMPAYLGGIAQPVEGGYDLMLAVAAGPSAPALSEPFATVALGAVTPAEVRLLAEAYLEGSGVEFSPAELRELGGLSAGHPAYLQRAAYHLFEARRDPGYDWRAAYKAEARERPVVGAPLPPEAFVGQGDDARAESRLGELSPDGARAAPERMPLADIGGFLAALLPPAAALAALLLTNGSMPAALAVLVVGYLLVAVAARRRG